ASWRARLDAGVFRAPRLTRQRANKARKQRSRTASEATEGEGAQARRRVGEPLGLLGEFATQRGVALRLGRGQGQVIGRGRLSHGEVESSQGQSTRCIAHQ